MEEDGEENQPTTKSSTDVAMKSFAFISARNIFTFFCFECLFLVQLPTAPDEQITYYQTGYDHLSRLNDL